MGKLIFISIAVIITAIITIGEFIAEYDIRRLIKAKPYVFTKSDKNREKAYMMSSIIVYGLSLISGFVYACIINW